MTIRSWTLCMLACLAFTSHPMQLVGAVPQEGLPPPLQIPEVQPEPSAERSYRMGIEHLSRGGLDRAEAAFNASLRLQADFLPALLGLAEVALRRNLPTQAEKHLQEALQLAPQNAAVHTIWGRYLYAQKRFQESEAAFKEALTLAPNAMRPRVALGELYLRGLRQPAQAVQTYREALALDASRADLHYGLGLALATTGEAEEAQQAFAEAGRLAPENPLPLQALGRLHAAQKDYDKALESFANALKARPTFAPAHIARGDIFVVRKEDDNALLAYEAAARSAPKLALVQVKLGMLHERNKRLAQAEQAYRTAIALDPAQAIAYNNLAWSAAERGEQLNEALAWAKKAVELAPQVVSFQDTLAWVYRAQGDYAQAVTVLETVTSGEAPHAILVYHLGVVYAEQGERERAITALQKALDLQPDFAEAADAQRRLQELRQP